MLDSACGSGTHISSYIGRSVPRSDQLVELLQSTTRRPGGHRPNQFQGLLIHLVLAKTPG